MDKTNDKLKNQLPKKLIELEKEKDKGGEQPEMHMTLTLKKPRVYLAVSKQGHFSPKERDGKLTEPDAVVKAKVESITATSRATRYVRVPKVEKRPLFKIDSKDFKIRPASKQDPKVSVNDDVTTMNGKGTDASFSFNQLAGVRPSDRKAKELNNSRFATNLRTQSDSNFKKENSVDNLFKNMLGNSTENSQIGGDKLPNFNS